MSRSASTSEFVAGLGSLAFCALACAGFAGCGAKAGDSKPGGKFAVADAKGDLATPAADKSTPATNESDEASPPKLFAPKKAAAEDSPGKPPVVSSEKLGDYRVPEGEPEEVHAFLISLGQRQPRGRNDDERRVDFMKIQQARMEAAGKLLGTPEIAKELRMEAVSAKLSALKTLERLEVPEAGAEFDSFLTSLTKDKDPDLARLGRLMKYDVETMGLVAQAKEEKTDAKPIVERLKKLLADEAKDADTFNFAKRTASALEELGQPPEFIAACRAIGEAFEANEDKDIAREGQNLLDVALFVEVEFQDKLEAAAKGQPDSIEPLVEAIRTVLAGKRLGVSAFEQTSQAANIMEFTGNIEASKQILDLVGKAFKEHPEEKVVEAAAQAVANGAKRRGLIGEPLAVEGNLVDGSKFDWSKYEGKVVLLDFWATWCGPCIREMPNVKQNYEKYKDRGFEVVGINCDDDLESVEQFFTQRPLPWENIHSTDPQAFGLNNPLAQKCGVDAIPFMVLINAQGKVEAIHVHGKKLGEKLAAIFDGAKSPDADPAEKPAAETGRKGPPPKKPVDKKTGSLFPARAPVDGEGPTYFIAVADEDAKPEDESNPYLADANLSPEELAAFILKMQDKPKSIQKRPGFGEAIVDAADRILAAPGKDKAQLVAIEAKLESLHKRACLGDEQCDKDLVAFVESLKADARDRVAREVKFFRLERQAIEADKLPLEKVPELLAQLKEFFAKEKLADKHLRIASSTVALVNRLADGDAREKEFKEIGALLAKSSDKQLARYGKKLAKPPAETESKLVGRPLELEGNTSEGQPFKWEAYRGKVVLVDFWATWCGPCRREMPHVKELYEKHKDKGFEVIGVSLDKDLEALADYLEENAIAWTTLSGEETQDLAEKYGVRGIPTMMLVDKEGKIVAVGHNVGGLTAQLEKLLAPAAK